MEKQHRGALGNERTHHHTEPSLYEECCHAGHMQRTAPYASQTPSPKPERRQAVLLPMREYGPACNIHDTIRRLGCVYDPAGVAVRSGRRRRTAVSSSAEGSAARSMRAPRPPSERSYSAPRYSKLAHAPVRRECSVHGTAESSGHSPYGAHWPMHAQATGYREAANTRRGLAARATTASASRARTSTSRNKQPRSLLRESHRYRCSDTHSSSTSASMSSKESDGSLRHRAGEKGGYGSPTMRHRRVSLSSSSASSSCCHVANAKSTHASVREARQEASPSRPSAQTGSLCASHVGLAPMRVNECGAVTFTECTRYRNSVTRKLLDLYDEVNDMVESRENMLHQLYEAMRADERYVTPYSPRQRGNSHINTSRANHATTSTFAPRRSKKGSHHDSHSEKESNNTTATNNNNKNNNARRDGGGDKARSRSLIDSTRARVGVLRCLAPAPTAEQQDALQSVVRVMLSLQQASRELVSVYLSPTEKRYFGVNTHLFQSRVERATTYQYSGPAVAEHRARNEQQQRGNDSKHDTMDAQATTPITATAAGLAAHGNDIVLPVYAKRQTDVGDGVCMAAAVAGPADTIHNNYAENRTKIYSSAMCTADPESAAVDEFVTRSHATADDDDSAMVSVCDRANHTNESVHEAHGVVVTTNDNSCSVYADCPPRPVLAEQHEQPIACTPCENALAERVSDVDVMHVTRDMIHGVTASLCNVAVADALPVTSTPTPVVKRWHAASNTSSIRTLERAGTPSVRNYPMSGTYGSSRVHNEDDATETMPRQRATHVGSGATKITPAPPFCSRFKNLMVDSDSDSSVD